MSKRDVDKYYPRNGPCMFHSTRYARHRLIDAIKGRYAAGESVRSLAADYERSRKAILAAIASTPDDNRMTPKEIREGKAEWQKLAEEMRKANK